MLKMIPTSSVDEGCLRRIPDFRFNAQVQIILGLGQYRAVQKTLRTSDGVNTTWYTFKNDWDPIDVMKKYHNGDLISVACFVPK